MTEAEQKVVQIYSARFQAYVQSKCYFSNVREVQTTQQSPRLRGKMSTVRDSIETVGERL